jgi:hypothetical protein
MDLMLADPALLEEADRFSRHIHVAHQHDSGMNLANVFPLGAMLGTVRRRDGGIVRIVVLSVTVPVGGHARFRKDIVAVPDVERCRLEKDRVSLQARGFLKTIEPVLGHGEQLSVKYIVCKRFQARNRFPRPNCPKDSLRPRIYTVSRPTKGMPPLWKKRRQ